MAVFLAASDETGTADGRGNLFFGGFVAPTLDWVNDFTPAWEERVLNGKPPIPHLHMVDIRSRTWRAKHCITEYEADRRIDEACRVINSMGSLFLIRSSVNEGRFKELFGNTGLVRLRSRQPAVDKFPADAVAFLAFAFVALSYGMNEGAEKVDFLIERKQGVTPVLEDLHARMGESMAELGHPEFAPIIGDFIPAGKERVPLQAADVACWHFQREDQDRLSMLDYVRMRKIGSRFGFGVDWRDEWLEIMAENAKQNLAPSPFKPKPKPETKAG